MQRSGQLETNLSGVVLLSVSKDSFVLRILVTCFQSGWPGHSGLSQFLFGILSSVSVFAGTGSDRFSVFLIQCWFGKLRT